MIKFEFFIVFRLYLLWAMLKFSATNRNQNLNIWTNSYRKWILDQLFVYRNFVMRYPIDRQHLAMWCDVLHLLDCANWPWIMQWLHRWHLDRAERKNWAIRNLCEYRVGIVLAIEKDNLNIVDYWNGTLGTVSFAIVCHFRVT